MTVNEVSTIATVYYLVHKDSLRRLKWYKTLAGARIAQRLRNRALGFTERLDRVVEDDREFELCANGVATYCIVEDVIESNSADLISK
jgi:hypothetical protein